MKHDDVWPAVVMRGGRWMAVEGLLASGEYKVTVAGNSVYGWQARLCGASGEAWERLSPVFHRDQGDSRKQLVAAVCRAYGGGFVVDFDATWLGD